MLCLLFLRLCFLKADEPSDAAIQKGQFSPCKMFSNSAQEILTLTFFSPFVSKPLHYLLLGSYCQGLSFNFSTLNGSKLLLWAGIEISLY